MSRLGVLLTWAADSAYGVGVLAYQAGDVLASLACWAIEP